VPALLFALPCAPDEPRGNVTTALRLGRGLTKLGWSVARCDARTDPADWPTADVVVALHAVNTAPLVPHPRLVVLFTGTDLSGTPSAAAHAAVARAVSCVALGESAAAQARLLYPECAGKLHLIRQAVEPLPESNWPVGVPHPEAATDLLLLPTGLRPVKDPWRALTALAPLAAQRPWLRLWIAGPLFGDDPIPVLPPWARYLGAVPREHLRPLIESAQIVISTSRAEGGPPNALLEAAECGRPILASDIPAHREFPGADSVFDNDADFRTMVEALLTDLPRAARLGKQLQQRIHSDFSLAPEAAAWDALLRSVL
jgi:glycosyltransferase involved in cell wall biosynthesis